MIGLVKEKRGVYLLEEPARLNSNKNKVCSFFSKSSLSNKDKIWLSHLRLGHPPFIVHKKKFPSLFLGIDIDGFHCEVCEFAKHKCNFFPISNKRTSIPFSLIHSDVWGSSMVPNISGPRWFVLFVDDCTRVSWVFLLKHKSYVCSTFQTFFHMI